MPRPECGVDQGDRVDAAKFILWDRDWFEFTAAGDAVCNCPGIRILRSPGPAPRANAIMGRWIGGCRRELLDETLIWPRRYLLRIPCDYEAHQR
ncbi:MAG: hypothetical protein ACYDAQ_17690 [Mycobacteriales bacterium]